jgi:hypothetical protein
MAATAPAALQASRRSEPATAQRALVAPLELRGATRRSFFTERTPSTSFAAFSARRFASSDSTNPESCTYATIGIDVDRHRVHAVLLGERRFHLGGERGIVDPLAGGAVLRGRAATGERCREREGDDPDEMHEGSLSRRKGLRHPSAQSRTRREKRYAS